MKQYNKTSLWFTLIEVVVSVAIMGVILVAIMGMFFSMSWVAHKTDINRKLQWNIKNAIEIMAEDIRNNGIASECDSLVSEAGEFWCDTTGNKYQIWKKDSNWDFSPTIGSECSDGWETCYILKNLQPLSNSFMHVKNIHFEVLWDESFPRLSIQITAQPSLRKWVKLNLIKNNIILFQTTLSESFLPNN